MTFGIDIASSQRDIDIPRAKAEGVEFVVVKMGGLNVIPQYVAPHYKAQIDRVVAAGLPKGHYYLIGGGQVWQTPTEQARFFVSNLYRFDLAHDVLMLDNEGLDSNGYLFDDAEAAEFMAEVIRLTGIPANRVWHYAGANDYRNLGPWPLITELGIRFVWAAYGDYPTGHLPDHEPSLQGSIPRWDVHQYSSLARVAGLNLDGNYSRLSVAELFGGGRMTFEDKFREYARLYPKPSTGEPSWDQMCGNLMFRFGAFTTPDNWHPTRTGLTAWDVALASGPRNIDASRAPIGAIHWWRNKVGNTPGHTAVDLVGGGTKLGMATYAVAESLGAAIGIQSVAGYSNAKSFMQYEGWTDNYASARHSRAATAGLDVERIEDEKGDDMTALIAREGILYFADGLGVDRVADFVSADMGNDEVVNGLKAALGDWTPYGGRGFDVTAALMQRRWARKLQEMAAAIAVGVNPDISQEQLDLAVKRAIPATLDFDVDDAAAQKIAEFVQNEQDERERARLQP